MFNSGHEFEACLSQAAVIESMLFFIVIMENKRLLGKLGSTHKIDKFTFGQLKTLAKNNNIFEDHILIKLEDYLDIRNDLVHNLCKRIKVPDFKTMFNEGYFFTELFNKRIQNLFTILKIEQNLKLK